MKILAFICGTSFGLVLATLAIALYIHADSNSPIWAGMMFVIPCGITGVPLVLDAVETF